MNTVAKEGVNPIIYLIECPACGRAIRTELDGPLHPVCEACQAAGVAEAVDDLTLLLLAFEGPEH